MSVSTHRPRTTHWIVGALGALVVLLMAGVGQAGGATGAGDVAEPMVLVTTVDDEITPVIAAHLDDAVDKAEDGGYEALVVRLDTPGGLVSSMRHIVQRFLAADVPVVVYVAPDGARAASAGAFITMAAHVAAMAPGTAIGASTPVGSDGSDLDRKIVNDAAAVARSIAEVRGRDVDFAVDAVRLGRSISAEEAVSIGAVDLQASSLDDLLAQLDGRSVTVGPDARAVTLHTAGAAVDDYDMGLLRQIQQALADPNLAYLFLSIATLGLLVELASPGLGAGAIVAIVGFVLALFGLSVLPVSSTGLLLLGLALVLFVVELLAPGVGVAAVGGAVALALSGVFLFRGTPGLSVSGWVIAPVVIVVGGVVVAGGFLGRAGRPDRPAAGPDGFVGRAITVRQANGYRAAAQLNGTWWRLRSANAPLADGRTVWVVAVEGPELVVSTSPPVGSVGSVG